VDQRKEIALQTYLRIRKAARVWLLRRQPPCKEMVPLMSQSLERSLSLGERWSLRLHLLVCTWCVLYLAQIRFLRQLVRLNDESVSEETSVPFRLSSEARARIARSINNQNQRS